MSKASHLTALTSTKPHPAETIDSQVVLDRQLDRLVAADPRLADARARAGDIPPRREPGGFAGLARIVNAQMISVASAAAIHARFLALGPTSESLAGIDDAALRGVGLSGAKIKTLRAIAAAELSGALDYAALPHLSAEDAIAMLTALPGIGRWSAEIYLLFCTGHPDILPAGDLALRKAAHSALGLEAEPDEKHLRLIAKTWSPWRGAAAHLLWRHYAREHQREGVLT